MPAPDLHLEHVVTSRYSRTRPVAIRGEIEFDIQKLMTDDFVRAPAKKKLSGRVPEQHDAIESPHHDRGWRPGHDGAEQPFLGTAGERHTEALPASFLLRGDHGTQACVSSLFFLEGVSNGRDELRCAEWLRQVRTAMQRLRQPPNVARRMR